MFTRREKISAGLILLAVLIVFLVVLFAPALIESAAEFLYLLVIVIPVGWLLATDRERIHRIKSDDEK